VIKHFVIVTSLVISSDKLLNHIALDLEFKKHTYPRVS